MGSPCADFSTVSSQILSLYPGQLTARGLEHRNGTLIQPPWFQITFESMKVLFVCLCWFFFINLVGALLSPWASPVSLRWRLILVTEDNYFLDIYFNLNIKRRGKNPQNLWNHLSWSPRHVHIKLDQCGVHGVTHAEGTKFKRPRGGKCLPSLCSTFSSKQTLLSSSWCPSETLFRMIYAF